MENLFAMFPAMIGLMASPGPVTLASAAAGAAYGWRAWPYVFIMTTGTLTVIILVAIGAMGLLATVPGIAPLVGALAGLYILWLAWKIATAPPLGALADQAALPPLWGGYVMAILNPKAYGAMAAIFSGFPLMPDAPFLGGAVQSTILFCWALTVNTVWMSAGVMLARLMRDPVANRILNVFFAVLLVLSVALLVWPEQAQP
ncbi:MAG: LysE family translocator [Pseudomonadota bacterium]